MNDKLTDNFGRVIKSLRISITKKCDLKCIFCHQEGEKHAPEKEMSVENIVRIVTAATEFGVDKVKFSGGEPLMR
ncbi:MAG: radical SAM protein, partial [Euryarchaeota archaeon]|nr:radical SAM protein [Euryarchaeota archaeon]